MLHLPELGWCPQGLQGLLTPARSRWSPIPPEHAPSARREAPGTATCPPWQGPEGLPPPARTLARASRRRPWRERRSRRNRRATSGTSTAQSCRSRLWDRDRTIRSCGGTDGQVDRQMGGHDRQREDTQTNGQRGEKDGGGREGLKSPWTPWARSGPHSQLPWGVLL